MGSSSEGSSVCVIFRMSSSGSKFPLWTVFLFMDTWSPLMALLRGQETHGGRGRDAGRGGMICLHSANLSRDSIDRDLLEAVF